MIFVSYSSDDIKWRKAFVTISKPLTRTIGNMVWTDEKMGVGKSDPQIVAAMANTKLAVLLVSAHFLASDYCMKIELPYLLEANKAKKLEIIWALLEPCLYTYHPEFTDFHAMKFNGKLEPLSSLTEWQWKTVMVSGCGMIDDFFKKLEQPIINPSVITIGLARVTNNFQLLAKPAFRDVEVLVHSADQKWWRQERIKAGSCSTRIYLGNERTKSKTTFPVVALTTSQPLAHQTYLSMPDYRTRADTTLFRA